MLGGIFNSMPHEHEVDVTDEMKDLKKIYEESVEILTKREDAAKNDMIYYLRNFLDIHDNKRKLEEKLYKVKDKIEACEDEEDEE